MQLVSRYLLFLSASVHTISRIKHHKLIITFWIVAVAWIIKQYLVLKPDPPNNTKYILQILPMTKSISSPSFVNKEFTIQKIYLKNIL